MIEQTVIEYFNFLVRTYDDVTGTITSAKNRVQALNKDADVKHDKIIQGLESTKGQISRQIEKWLEFFPVWQQWLKGVPGIGPWIAGKLIIMYYFRFTPICPDCETPVIKKEVPSERDPDKKIKTFYCEKCEKTVKGQGNLTFKITEKDFPTISKWWAYLGMHCNEDGIKPKRKAGVQSNWSTEGRTLCYQIGEQFNRHTEDDPYKAFLNGQKRKHEKKHPEWKKGHIHNAAKNEAEKLFLSHFWVVARTLDGKPVSEPYAGVIMGHTNIIKPFYWEPISTLRIKSACEPTESLNPDSSCETQMAVNE